MHIFNCRIQLAVNVQIPVEYGGLGGKAIYIGKCYIFISVLIPVSFPFAACVLKMVLA